MSLKLRLLIIVSIILLINFAAAGYFMVQNARLALAQEMASSTQLAKGLLVNALPTLRFSNDLSERLTLIVDSVRHTRHIRAWFEDMHGEPLIGQEDQTGFFNKPDAPDWFIRMMEPEAVAFRRLITKGSKSYGYLVVEADPSDEVTEVWQDIQTLFWLGVFFLLLILSLIYLALRQGLRPLSQLSDALGHLEQGDFTARVDTSAVKELNPIQIRFNHMASVLEKTMAENHALAGNMLSLQESQQRDLARELHDELAPCLFGIRVDLGEIERIAGENHLIEIEEKVGSVKTITNHIQSLVRKMLSRLRPMTLDDLGLTEALRDMLHNWRERQPEIDWEWDFVGEFESLPDTLQVTIYRLVQECTTNCVRHAHASHVKVEVRRETETIKVAVTDDGKGLDANLVKGFGLIGMRERVSALGGRIAFDTEEGRGLQVRVLIPLKGEAKNETGINNFGSGRSSNSQSRLPSTDSTNSLGYSSRS
ncbi:MAG: LapD/MoxY N-terminal periplasmic domain-containing protein [Pseudomonadota bacterium]|uniref:LapD/MoxY N-terminal periplasmic domain-containing protein n=1 Tax=Methylophaga TaxID=40222 RepID=UPI0024E25774|nr:MULTISPECIES: LapD/MoxY N-terminal periplasmic domain-containing protein [Methylophaga]MEC9412268.1 LapD/MoxY N-terminal periplasmic domain-containing protein [Pseudomonadota bacterium]WVI84966.1 LapD/MoxY N-terminal periplasmic domain-containing protein [Methylophaga thalassica]